MKKPTADQLGCLVMSLYFGGASVALYGGFSSPEGEANTEYSKVHEVRKIERYLEDLNNRTVILVYHPNSATKALRDIEREEPLLWQSSKYCSGLTEKGSYHFTSDHQQILVDVINDKVNTRLKCKEELEGRLETITHEEGYAEEKQSYDEADKKSGIIFKIGGIIFLLGLLGLLYRGDR